MKVLLMTAVAAMALGAVGASSASASIVNAKFSTPSFKLTTTGFTVTRNGTESKTCTPAAISGFGEGNSFIASNEWTGGTRFTCTDKSSLVMALNGLAYYDTVAERYYLHVADHTGSQSLEGPWGPYFQEASNTDDWTWVNGSGSTSSSITLNEQWIGATLNPYKKITISGTFTVKSATGGLITLSH
jgi:hypothetical protein